MWCSFQSHSALARPSLVSPPRLLRSPLPSSSSLSSTAATSSSTTRPHAAVLSISCSLGSPTAPLEPFQCQPKGEDSAKGWSPPATGESLGGRGPSVQDGKREGGGDEEEGEEEGKQGISGIYVPRQKYIPVPKGDLLDGILSLFDSKEDADEFLRLAKY